MISAGSTQPGIIFFTVGINPDHDDLSGHFFFFVQKKLPLEALQLMVVLMLQYNESRRVKHFSQLEGRPVVHMQAHFIPDYVAGEKRF